MNHRPPFAIPNCRSLTMYTKSLNNDKAAHPHRQISALSPSLHTLLIQLIGFTGPGQALKERLSPDTEPSHKSSRHPHFFLPLRM